MPASPNEIRSKLQKVQFEFGQVQRHAEEAQNELKALETILDPRSLKWVCDGCGYTKQFTKPMTSAACDSCPRCKGMVFLPVRVN